jgi:hypothetical protein
VGRVDVIIFIKCIVMVNSSGLFGSNLAVFESIKSATQDCLETGDNCTNAAASSLVFSVAFAAIAVKSAQWAAADSGKTRAFFCVSSVGYGVVSLFLLINAARTFQV